MYKFCVFAGTTEGRELTAWLLENGAAVTACTATEYGRELLKDDHRQQADGVLQVRAGRMDAEEMAALLSETRFDLVLDATHPYAKEVTEQITKACAMTGTECLRVLRGSGDTPEDAVFMPDIEACVSWLNGQQGKILLTTGSKQLDQYTGITGFAERVYARVLPTPSSLALCEAAGLKPSHVIAMQGPFSGEMNAATLRSTGAVFMVTKDDGTAGGFEMKAEACRAAGARLVVLGRPPQTDGPDMTQTMEMLSGRFGFEIRPQVTICGIGPGNRSAMTGEVLDAIGAADCLIGADRMIKSVPVRPGQKTVRAIAAADIAAAIRENPGCRRFAVLMSGDAGFFSGTKKLLPLLEGLNGITEAGRTEAAGAEAGRTEAVGAQTACQVRVLPGISALSCLCAKAGCSYEDVFCVSLHGREHDIIPDVRAHARVFVLTGGSSGMADLCRQLRDAGLGDVRMTIGERMSYPEERMIRGTAAELCEETYDSISAALIERDDAIGTNDDNELKPVDITQTGSKRRNSRAAGLPDECFIRNVGENAASPAVKAVPMTKSEIRAVCMSRLALPEDAVCWDIGAGTGSVSVEMALQAPRGAVYAVERREDALDLIRQNAGQFALDNLFVIAGTAPEACENLPAPTHVFIGGSSGNMRDIIAAVMKKNPSAQIVATAVTLETTAELTACMKDFPESACEVVSLTVARGKKAGPYHLMKSENPVTIFSIKG